MLKREYLLELGIEEIINYLRKSRQDEELEKRTGEDTLTAQKELMDRVLEPLGIPYTQLKEIGSGDKIETRPVFQGIIKDIRNKRYQAIAVKEISRMGRGSYTDMGIIYDLIVDNRVFIVTPYKVYDPRNPADLRQIRFELFMSREEFETTRERLVGGRVNNAMGGFWVAGKAPFGFTYNKKTRKLEIFEEEARTVRALFDFYVNGVPTPNGKRRDVSFRALATYMTRHTTMTTPSGNQDWQYRTVRQLLTNERYIGKLVYRTTRRVNGKQIDRPEDEHIIVEDAHEPIIDQETFDKAQLKVAESTYKPRTKMDFSPCELASLCKCVICGKNLIRQYSVQNYKKTNGEVNQYHKEFLWCKTIGCTFVKYRDVEADIIESLEMLSNLDVPLFKMQIEEMAKKKKSRYKESESDILEYVAQKRKSLNDRKKFIYDKYETGRYDDETFDERMKELNAEYEKLTELERSSSAQSMPDDEKPFEMAQVNIRNAIELYNSRENKSDKNEILRAIISHVDVELIEKGRGRKPAIFKLSINLNENIFGLV